MKVYRILVLQTVHGWYWKAVARNGRKLGWTGEHHKNRSHCLKVMEAVTGAKERGIPVFLGTEG